MRIQFEPSCHVPRRSCPESADPAPVEVEPVAAGTCCSCGEPSADGRTRDVALVLFQCAVRWMLTLDDVVHRLGRASGRTHRTSG